MTMARAVQVTRMETKTSQLESRNTESRELSFEACMAEYLNDYSRRMHALMSPSSFAIMLSKMEIIFHQLVNSYPSFETHKKLLIQVAQE